MNAKFWTEVHSEIGPYGSLRDVTMGCWRDGSAVQYGIDCRAQEYIGMTPLEAAKANHAAKMNINEVTK